MKPIISSCRIFFALFLLLFSSLAFAGPPELLHNYVGLTLLITGIALIVVEIYLFTFGFLAASGLIVFMVGSVLLFGAVPDFALAWPVAVGVGLVMLIFILLVVGLAIRTARKKIITGREGLLGKEGEVLQVKNDQLLVRVAGELWQAKSPQALQVGEKIRVTHLSGLELTVEPSYKK